MLLYKSLLAVDDIDALCRCFYFSALEVIDGCSLSVFTFHLVDVCCNLVAVECECECLCTEHLLVLPIGVADVVGRQRRYRRLKLHKLKSRKKRKPFLSAFIGVLSIVYIVVDFCEKMCYTCNAKIKN